VPVKGAWARGAVLPSCAPPGGFFGTPGPRKGGRGEGERWNAAAVAGGCRGAEIFFPLSVSLTIHCRVRTTHRTTCAWPTERGRDGRGWRGRSESPREGGGAGSFAASSSSGAVEYLTLTLMELEAAGYVRRWLGDEESGNPNPCAPAAGYAPALQGTQPST